MKRKREDEDGPIQKRQKTEHEKIKYKLKSAIKHDYIDGLLNVLKENNKEFYGIIALHNSSRKQRNGGNVFKT